MLRKTGDIFLANLGGDSCYHYNVAKNISEGIGPKRVLSFRIGFHTKVFQLLQTCMVLVIIIF